MALAISLVLVVHIGFAGKGTPPIDGAVAHLDHKLLRVRWRATGARLRGGRGGLGSINVKSAGNDNVDGNGEYLDASRFTVTVAALDSSGTPLRKAAARSPQRAGCC